MIKYDLKNGKKIYNEILDLFKDNIEDSFYDPNEELVFEGDSNGEVYINDGGVININSSFYEDEIKHENWFNIEIIEPSEIIEENISKLENIISKYKNWEIIE